MQHTKRMPVVRGCDFNRIDIGALQHIMVVNIRLTAWPGCATLFVEFIHHPARRLSPSRSTIPVTTALEVDITDRNHLHALVLEKASHVARALVSDANKCHRHAVTWRNVAIAAEGTRRNNPWKRDRSSSTSTGLQ